MHLASFSIIKAAIVSNVRRYVQLAQSRGGACFCTRGAMQDYDVISVILALAKTVTPAGGPRREPGRAVPLTTKRCSLARKFSRYRAAIAYTGLLEIVAASILFIRNTEDLTRIRLNRNGYLLAMPLQPRKRRDTAELGCIALPC